MSIEVNKERLIETFLNLAKIRSPSKKEEEISRYIEKIFRDLNADEIFYDNYRNLIIRFNGEGNFVMLNSHLDTVEDTPDINVQINGDIIKTDGKTILGADAKSGVAEIIEAIRMIKENGLKHRSLEIVFTREEEIGLYGAKNLDYSKLKSKYGFVLDHGDVDEVVVGAPSACRIHIKIYGIKAHAGASPEKGINAIQVASKAIARMPCGRIDSETTANVGVIKGGTASNIVPDYVEIKAEARSHKEYKLEMVVNEIKKCVFDAIKESAKIIDGELKFARDEIDIRKDYKCFRISEDDEIVKEVFEAGRHLGFDMHTAISGGGSDANVFNEKGIKCVILGTGMQKVHTHQEFIKISDMVNATKLIFELIKR